MPDIPHDIQFPLADFDRSQLPEDQRGLQGDAYLQAIREHLTGQFVGQGGAAEVAVAHDRVIIRWKESGKPESLAEQGANLLKKGNTEKGVATLRLALQRDPHDAAALFNLGMALGDAGEAAEALELLQRLVTAEPGYPGAWVALGVAQGRNEQWDAAIKSFSVSVSRNPQDGFARKNLGAALSQTGQLDEARDHLKAAVVLLPSDAQAWLNLAMNLEQSGVTAEAEIAYQRVIDLDPGGHLAEKAEAARNRITQVKFRKDGGGELRLDVLTYCGDALRMFGTMPKEEVQRITMEIAMLGASGLSVTDPTIKHKLRHLPGDYSGLHLLCLEYVGFQIIDPTVDMGFDIAAEYAEACRVS
jgi:tetratricopeptide (TPR) repeat protein